MGLIRPKGFVILENKFEPMEQTIIGDSNGVVTIETKLQNGNNRNRNGRFYQTVDLGKQIKAPRIQELQNAGTWYGERNHPSSSLGLQRQSIIDLGNTSHSIDKIWMDDDTVIGELSNAPGPVGDQWKESVNRGKKTAYSLRALGTLAKSARGNEVQDLKIITYDWVLYPSHECAYQTKILGQDKEATNESSLLVEDTGILIPIMEENAVDYIMNTSIQIRELIEDFEFEYDKVIIENATTVRASDSASGITLILPVDDYLQREMMNYASSKKNK